MGSEMCIRDRCRGVNPKHGADCWFAENATIVGDVEMGDQCSVWFNTVIRGDVNSIRMAVSYTHLTLPTILRKNGVLYILLHGRILLGFYKDGLPIIIS